MKPLFLCPNLGTTISKKMRVKYPYKFLVSLSFLTCPSGAYANKCIADVFESASAQVHAGSGATRAAVKHTPNDAAIIKEFVDRNPATGGRGERWWAITEKLRADSPLPRHQLDDIEKAMVREFDEVLKKMPHMAPGTVYRGISDISGAVYGMRGILETYTGVPYKQLADLMEKTGALRRLDLCARKPCNEIVETFHLSTSFSEAIAVQHLVHKTGGRSRGSLERVGVLFKIEGKSGRVLQDLERRLEGGLGTTMEEVVFKPGAKFAVTAVEQHKAGYWILHLKEL